MTEPLISREELSEALNIEVISAKIQPLQTGIRGYMSDVHRVLVKTASDERSVILKTASSNVARRNIAERFGSYRNEQRFYSQLVQDLPFRIPHCYLNKSDRFLLLLEDLGDSGVIDPLVGVSVEQASLAMQTLAKMHGHFRVTPPEVHQPITVGLEAAAADMQSFVRDALKNHSTDLTSALELAIHYAEKSGDYVGFFQQQDQVFTHMDYRADNLRFLSDLVILDWGESTHAPVGFDIAGFLTNSVIAANRNRWEQSLLDTYTETLNASGVDTDRETVFDSYRLALLPALYLPGLVAAHGNINEGSALIERSLTAIDDHLAYLSNVVS